MEVAATLVVPTACSINRTRRVKRVNAFRRIACVELPPTLVEKHPRNNRRMAGKHVHHGIAGARPVTAVRRIVGTKRREMLRRVVAVLVPRGAHERRLAIRGPRVIFAAARHRVLPYEHAEAVAMVVPACSLNFDMLAQHIEAGFLHGGYVMNQRFVARRGQQAVRPIPLVEHTLEEQRFAIEMESRNTLQIRLDLNRSECAIRVHNILLFLRFFLFLLLFLRFHSAKFQRRRHVIQIRIFRRP